MRIYAERRPNEFQEQHFPRAPQRSAAPMSPPARFRHPPDHTSITYTPYR